MRRAGLLLAAMAAVALPLAAQRGAAAAETYTISGVVRSASTGAPLDRAEVTLSTAGTEETEVAEVLTGEGGAFRFDHLDPGKYVLAASRRGYITARYQEHEEGYSTAIVTGPDLVSTGLHFDLFPTAVIGGVITDDSGAPVPDAQVTLYRQEQQGGQSKVVNADSDSTDETGTFEFDRLRSGTYYLCASARPWYAFRPPPRTDSAGNPLPDQPPAPLDVAYATTFYANATDSGSATPIPLAAGDHPELNITLHAVPAIHMTIRLPRPNPTTGFSIPQLEQEVFGSEQFQAPGQVTMHTDGDQMLVDLGGVAPGHYMLRNYGPDGAGRTTSVDLATNQTVDVSTTGGSTDVSGKLEMASGAALPAITTLQLIPAGGGNGQNTMVSADGSFDLRAVPPGDYTVQVATSTGPLDVVQMAASGAEIHGSRVTIAGDPVLLAASLGRGSVSITGYARRDGRGVGGAMILLVPEHPQDNPDLFRRDQSDSDGSFTLPRVLPGNYTLVALENGWSLEWSRPEVIAPYLARGLRLHITDETGTLALPAGVDVQ